MPGWGAGGKGVPPALTAVHPPQSVENAVCVLRNLSYRLYDEMPPSALQRLEGRGRRDTAGAPPGEVVGCFTPQSRRLREVGADLGGWGQGARPSLADPLRPPAQLPLAADALTFAEVSKDPKGLEWLWSPQVVGLYNRLLQRCELNRHTTEAAAGALQNITAGDRRVRPRGPAGVLAARWGREAYTGVGTGARLSRPSPADGGARTSEQGGGGRQVRRRGPGCAPRLPRSPRGRRAAPGGRGPRPKQGGPQGPGRI